MAMIKPVVSNWFKVEQATEVLSEDTDLGPVVNASGLKTTQDRELDVSIKF
jgi:hypothetical protein